MERPPFQPSALAALWFWRWEAGAVLGLPLAAVELDHRTTAGVSLAILASTAAVLLLSRRARRAARRRIRAVLVQHRLRVGCVEIGLISPLGRLPWLVWTSPTPDGEAVWVALPAGLSEESLRAAVPILTGATRAASVSVRPHRSCPRLFLVSVRYRWEGMCSSTARPPSS